MELSRIQSLPFQKSVYAVLIASLLFVCPSPNRDAEAYDSSLSTSVLDDKTLFVIGNTLFTVYHELGHALVDLLDLPVIGREEDAVDGFAAVTMIPEVPDDVRDAMIVAVADGWRAQSELVEDDNEPPYWGEHALDEQRHYAIVCLMVGSDQEGFYDYALDAGLPDERIETCVDDFELMRDGWERLLEPFERVSKPAQSPIKLLFDRPSEQHVGLLDLIMQGGLLEAGVARLAQSIALPEVVTIRFATCNNANAYWVPDAREVMICYELVDEFDAILTDAAMH
jgi:hypothetical protein